MLFVTEPKSDIETNNLDTVSAVNLYNASLVSFQYKKSVEDIAKEQKLAEEKRMQKIAETYGVQAALVEQQ